MNPDCIYCGFKDGVNVEHDCSPSHRQVWNNAISACCALLDLWAEGHSNPEIHTIAFSDEIRLIQWHKQDAWRQAQYQVFHQLRVL